MVQKTIVVSTYKKWFDGGTLQRQSTYLILQSERDGFISNNSIATLRRGKPRPKRHRHKDGHDSSGEEEDGPDHKDLTYNQEYSLFGDHLFLIDALKEANAKTEARPEEVPVIDEDAAPPGATLTEAEILTIQNYTQGEQVNMYQDRLQQIGAEKHAGFPAGKEISHSATWWLIGSTAGNTKQYHQI